MDALRFVYVTYIASTPEKIWNALIDPKMTAQYWQNDNLSDWKVGSRWEHRGSGEDRTLRLVGSVLECAPPARLAMTWAFPADASNEAKHTRVAFDLEAVNGVVRLTVTHDRLEPGSEMLAGITAGVAEGDVEPEVAPRDRAGAAEALVARALGSGR
jgi:uncharacterized protein YndB with AHSA1/START domain